MLSDKEVKKEFRTKASKEPDKYYATSVLKTEGFSRKQCVTCKKFFWSVNTRTVCGDPSCCGGFQFLGSSLTKKTLSYSETWTTFSKLFKKLGYTPIPRYPVIARWRDDTDFVQASIYDFQPHVVSGAVEPPANPLVVPQFCLRFNDIDNVGITGAHYTGFVMVGQHAFMQPKEWNQTKYFTDIHNWNTKGLGISKEELVYHEDAWAGGGNFGPCMEFFCKGLELGNQVYMMYENTIAGPKELNLKVLDMGMGLERNAWFSQAKATSYETTFPDVIKHLRKATGVEYDDLLMSKFLPFASFLNADETDDLNKSWAKIAKLISIDAQLLCSKIQPISELYSVAEHARSLLVALHDGGMPSNVGGMYNLRVILRRALGFIQKNKWNVSLPEICEWHAKELKPLFPELNEYLDDCRTILDVERTKYLTTSEKAKEIVAKLVRSDITTETLIDVYDSQGINPDLVAEEAKRAGKSIKVPDTFYSLVAERHQQKDQEHQTTRTEQLALEGLPDTKALYWDDYTITEFSAKIVKIIGNNMILDQTLFYPTSGGQLHDTGFINNQKVVDVFKQGGIIVHVLAETPKIKSGSTVSGIVDKERREQLSQHHTATHIINASCRKVLGPHAQQASAKKDVDKSYIDITHYESLSDNVLRKIEAEANKIVLAKKKLTLSFVPRTKAEQQHSMTIYQGGAVPGKLLRIVQIQDTDVQACGGTHLHTTAEAGTIKLLKSTKVKDGVVRIFFVAGKAAETIARVEQERIAALAKLFSCKPAQITGSVQELFDKWKAARKAANKEQTLTPKDFVITSTSEFSGDILAKCSEILATQVEYVVKTCERFLLEMKEFKKKTVK